MTNIIGLIPTYREGPLAKGAINSLLKCCRTVVVFEGPLEGVPEAGEKTDLSDFKKNQRVVVKYGKWSTEVDKRNAMLAFTRRYIAPVWGVYLDADEILLDAEYLPDLIWAANHNAPEGENTAALPLLIQEIDSSVGKVYRIFRLDLLERHVLSMSQFKFVNSELVVTFPLLPVWRPGEPIMVTEEIQARPPMQGEPHIHHRAYYREKKRGETRMHQREVEDFHELERQHLQRLGLPVDRPGFIPVPQHDPGLIVAMEIDAEKIQEEVRKK